MGDARRVLSLRRVIEVALAGLMAASWPLWRGNGEFPQLPWLGWLTGVPRWVDDALLVALLIATVLTLCCSRGDSPRRCAASIQGLSLAGLVALDQHRLQPWMYELLILLGLATLARGSTAASCCRAAVISVYVWSGVSKIDPGFLAGHGRMLLDGLLQSIGLSDRLWTEAQRDIAAGMMPAGELAIAFLLALPRTRRFGLTASVVLHVALLLTLGPRGLKHECGVLVWNVYFIAQNVILFLRPRSAPDAPSISNAQSPIPNPQSPTKVDSPPEPFGGTHSRTDRLALGATFLVCLLPALNPWGLWDHWPSWSVYSAHPAIVQMEVRDADVARLPASLQPLVDPARPLEEWRHVRLDQWSFAQRRVPPYPETRWKLALAAVVAERAGLGEAVRVRLLERRSWWDAERSETLLEGTSAIEQRLSNAWINTRPRTR